MDCNKFQEMMSLYMDDQLSADEKKLFEEHIASCEDCKEELDFMQTIMNNVNDLNEEKELPTDFHENLMVKIDSINSTRKQTPSRMSRFNDLRRYYTAAAAVFIVVLIFGFIGISNLNNYKNDYGNYTTQDSTKEESSESAPVEKKSALDNSDKLKSLDKSEADVYEAKEDKKDNSSKYGTEKSENADTKMAPTRVNRDESTEDRAADSVNVQMEETKEEANTTEAGMVADEPKSDNVLQNVELLDGDDVSVQFKEEVGTATKENAQFTTTGEANGAEKQVKKDIEKPEENNNQWIIGSVILIVLCLILLLLIIFKKLKKNE